MLSSKFKETLWTLIDSSIGSIRTLEKSGALPTIKKRMLSIRTEGSYSWNENEFTNIPMILNHLSVVAEKTTEFAEFILASKADPMIGKHLEKTVGTTETLIYLRAVNFFNFILKLVFETNSEISSFNKQIFDKACAELESILSNDYFHLKYIAILENLDCEIKDGEVGGGIFIKGLSWEEVAELWNDNSLIQSHYPFSNFFYVRPTRIKSVLYISIDEPKIIVDRRNTPIIDPEEVAINRIKPLFERAEMALKLVKIGSVRLGPIIHQQPSLFPGEKLTHSGPAPPANPLFEYKLLSSDLDDLRTLFLALEKVDPSNKAFRIGLDRYNIAVERSTLEDALLDSMICCEAFLLNDIKERGELGFRFALRAANLLGKSSEEKRKIFLFAKNAYKIRSRIAHGNTLTPKQKDSLPDAVDLGRKIAREMVLLNAPRENPNWEEMLFS